MRVLAVGAHPDDVEAYAAGTVARYALRGDEVYVLSCTDGRMGHAVIRPEELVPIRAREAQEAARALGARLLTLGEPDGGLFADVETRRKLRELFAEVQPEVVLVHPPEDYHPDHRSACRLVEDVCGLQGGRGPVLLYMDTQEGLDFLPDVYVDVTGEAMERKLQALACHRSQVDWLREHDGIELVEWVRQAARMRGIQCGVEHAEAFRVARRWARPEPHRTLP